ncbi:hypothetical protein ACJX0J_039036, partial [Zea mays]
TNHPNSQVTITPIFNMHNTNFEVIVYPSTCPWTSVVALQNQGSTATETDHVSILIIAL